MMRVASSLTNRIFLASTLLAVLALGSVFYFVNARVSEEAEADLRRSATQAATPKRHSFVTHATKVVASVLSHQFSFTKG